MRKNKIIKKTVSLSALMMLVICFQNCSGGGFQSIPATSGSLQAGSSSSSGSGTVVTSPTPTATATPQVTATPTPVPTATPKATATPTPTPTATPKATATPVATATPTPAATNMNITMGVNGHDNRSVYPMTQTEAVFKLLDSKNLRSYRFDADPRNFTVLDQMVTLAKKYNILLRPMIYAPTTDLTQLQDVGYQVARRYANDIKFWEIGNEQDYDRAGAQDRLNIMAAMYKGVKKANDELGAGIKTTINVMACNSDDTSATGRCPGDKNGDMWFLDMAKASGFNFDYISFHYYAYYSDKGYWYNMFLGQMRAMATKYSTKIFYNEVNCADIYQGNTDSGKAGDKACYDSLQQLMTEMNTNYKDIVAEINIYELLDQTEIAGVEGHFGLMYNLSTPKNTFNLISSFAK